MGDELCGSKSKILQESMKKQCLSYFSHYHASRLDELRIFLEHDGWELCPVKSTFVASQLEEFKCLRPALNNYNTVSGSADGEHENSVVSEGWLNNYIDSGTTPFDSAADEIMDEDILSSFAVLSMFIQLYWHFLNYIKNAKISSIAGRNGQLLFRRFR